MILISRWQTFDLEMIPFLGAGGTAETVVAATAPPLDQRRPRPPLGRDGTLS